MERSYNVKILFHGKKVDRILIGDFGPVPNGEHKPTKMVSEDSLIAYPLDPEISGPSGIINAIGNPPVTERFWNSGGMSHFNV